ncbi:hypothetical protein CRM22_005903 [Opisthorchis felineus]|uniref:Cytoplasmic dynein 2 light intermediate chain 1 n=2 Tax=Opisthorchis felineus TaxID=147828 RepID=A0A4S2LW40_OPIFE|nr:hypothetical protein CRM22_005903 [Opisthorchis felineus]
MTQSVWDIAIQQHNLKNKKFPNDHEPTLIFVGNKSAGKSTIIHYFLDREDKPKPTLALDYTFGRKSSGAFSTKSTVHVWELGRGIRLADLIDATITPDSVWRFHLILVLDLSKPREMWQTMETLLGTLMRRYDQLLTRINKRDLPESLKSKYRELREARKTSSHPDKDLLNPFPLPLVIIGSKYDLFTTQQLEQQKMICKTLRFLNHFYGGSLYFVSEKEDLLMKRIKAVLNHIAFGTPEQRVIQTELGKPLSIPEGADCFSNIGAPPNYELEVSRLTAKTPLEMWKAVFCARFPQMTQSELAGLNSIVLDMATDPAKDPQYAEPLVDRARAGKDKELERIQQQNERRMRDLLQQAILDGVLIA